MAIKPCRDASAADWISNSELPWTRLVGFGPEGFDHHARLRFIPDPTREGQQESDGTVGSLTASGQGLTENGQLSMAMDILCHHTTTPEQLFIAYWDGFGFAMPAPRFELPHRDFFLYSATAKDIVPGKGAWDVTPEDQAPSQRWMPAPAFIWPADRAWCVAHDVDPHWAGIGATAEAIAALVAEDRLDIVTANPLERQPAYY